MEDFIKDISSIRCTVANIHDTFYDGVIDKV